MEVFDILVFYPLAPTEGCPLPECLDGNAIAVPRQEVVAKNHDSAERIAIRKIPPACEEIVDDLEVVVRPFCNCS